MRISAANIAYVAVICWASATTVSAFTTPSQRAIPGIQQTATPVHHRSLATSLNESDDKKGGFFGNMFGGGSTEDNAMTALRGNLPPHPSVRPHISPLNRFGPDPKVEPTSDPLPVHPDVRSGTLSNGLPYVILPNKSPPDRFEAHLQVFSGSSDELEAQQGIAHLTEHVAYMGSSKRERLFGTGSQTNAYTDFHHTVFYAVCPVKTPRGGMSMLPMALDALVDVMEARAEPSRLEKERAAVLSEMTMVNTIEYRVECQILSTLHRENRLAKRFPIGKESLIRSWQTDDVKSWHRQHYRPDNVLLYLVGDINPDEAERVIAAKFGRLSAEKQGSQIPLQEIKELATDLSEAVVDGSVKGAQSWHYPPVRHDWCAPVDMKVDPKLIIPEKKFEYDLQLQEDYPLDEKTMFLKKNDLGEGKKIRPHIFRHELLQSFSLHFFSKRPVEPVVDIDSFRKSLAKRVALAALQIRLNVGGRSDDPAFTFVEFNQLDSAREGCAVCSLDMTAEPHKWKEAISKSLSEIRKLGVYGVTMGEMERYASSLMTDGEQLAAQGDRISHGDQLSYLMETIANGHTFMSPEQSYVMTAKALSTLTIEDVNNAAAELCSHVTALKDGEASLTGPVIAVACTPKGVGEDDPAYCSEEGLVQAIYDACQVDVEPEEDVVVPFTLLPEDKLAQAMEANPPAWLGGQFSDGTPNTAPDTITRPFTLRRLGNGIRVGVSYNTHESQRGHLRLVAPGGRDAEKRLGFKKGSMSVGARTMQEGGAFGPWTREQVELFCVDHLLMVEINCSEESITVDFVFPTNNVGNVGFGDDVQLGITGTESVMQIVREIVVGFKWEDDALGRSKSSFRTTHESLLKNLENVSTERIMEAMTGNDDRFLSIDVDAVNDITLGDARNAVMSQMSPSNLEISVSGDFDVTEVLEMIYKYIGTIPADANKEFLKEAANLDKGAIVGSVPPMPNPGKFLEIELEDSDPRAVAYVAGSAPSAWGYLSDGSMMVDHIMARDKRASDYDRQRRKHPLFGHVALLLLSEIANRRLFSYVRERKQLTYDANFSFTGFERLMGGFFLVTVTASKENAAKALQACKETLYNLRNNQRISPDNVESAKRVVLNRHDFELRTTAYWAQLMSGIQEESVPLKGPLSFTDFKAVVEAITATDLQLALETLGIDDDELYTAIGRTVQTNAPETDGNEEEEEEDSLVRQAPTMGMRRGGALK
jgi:predicted Zn-dependent peptidase